ncbi:MAG: LLM class F420-dependent oxidoreductase [Alphaproteobacteria bacterium]|nr:LLM class F420-dependent oxidoreductase [Alphaproteobacteria bacterium]
MKLGYMLPLIDVGGDPAVVRELAQTAEGLGYDHLGAPDHVLGVNAVSRPNWGARNTSRDLFHDPFVLFGYLSACTTRIGFSTQVLILPQRQAALVAKQAACVDLLSGGRLRLGIGVGWNEAEYVALNENFRNRGRRSEEQVAVMRELWAAPHVDFQGEWHRIPDAGINPRPAAGRIPLWYGGHEDVTLRRIAKWGDGWIMLAHPPGEAASAALDRLHDYTRQAGRDPAEVGFEVWVSMGIGNEANWRAEAEAWKRLGVTHLTLNNWFGRYHHRRISERSLKAHLSSLGRYRAVVADLL